MNMQCLLDLDGVLVDFTGAVEKKYSVKIIEWNFDDHLPVSKSEFWAGCDELFWAGLDWTVDGKEILAAIEEAFGAENVCLLTSPCLTRGCLEGKKAWIEKHLPAYGRRYLMGPAKEFCAGQSRVLIDDRFENVRSFVDQGGKGVLVPRPWNLFANVLDPAEYVKESIKLILKKEKNG
jgi:hypothetical protein